MILKFQQGGAAPPPLIAYNPVMVTPPAASPARTTETSSSKADLTDKDLLEMVGKLDGLPSDIQLLTSELQNFYIDQKHGINTASLASKYMSILSKVKIANFNKKEYDNAFNILKSNGGLNEIAINEDGRIFCINTETNDFKLIRYEDLDANPEYQALTNSQLLQIRAYNKDEAFNSNITSTLQNGIGMDSVNKMIKDIISGLGTTSKSEEGQITSDAKKILTGLKDYEQAVKESAGEFNPILNNLYKYKIVDKNQTEQISNAFSYIYRTLPENMKTLLKIKSKGMEGGMAELLGKLITSQTNITNEFSLELDNGGSGKTSSSKSSKTGGISSFKMDPVSMLQAEYGQKEYITIQTAGGGNRGLQIPTLRMPIVTKDGKSIGANATLTDVSESGFAGYLNFENASMGGVMINTSGFGNIAVNGTALYTGYLPVDMEEYNTTGNIKPDIDLLARYKTAQNEIAEKKITDKEEINKIYQASGLPIMYGENGDVLMNYIKFGMLNGTALNSAFNEDATFADWLTEVSDANVIENTLNIINKGRSDSDRIDFDAESWFDGIMPIWNSHDSLYKGTIFIPINEDHFTATAGFGNYPEVGEAEAISIKQQSLDRVEAAKNSYNNPGNQL